MVQPPEYMRDILQKRTPAERNVQTLCSIVSSRLAVPRSRLKGFGDCAFGITVSSMWNVLPGSVTDCKSVGALKTKKGLKTHLFKSAFD